MKHYMKSYKYCSLIFQWG